MRHWNVRVGNWRIEVWCGKVGFGGVWSGMAWFGFNTKNKENKMAKKKTATGGRDEEQVSNGAENLVEMSKPYRVTVKIKGASALLFHAWNTESVETKSAAAKNSAVKKTDDLESYVYRDKEGYLGIAGKCFIGSLVAAAGSFADPRSPRKSAKDLIKAGVQALEVVSLLEPKTKEWDRDDKQRAVVQRSAITRTRPCMEEGWEVRFDLLIGLPTYISPKFLYELIEWAGMYCGLLDYRPTYGKFKVVNFELFELR